jgi:hypothetical protein
MANAAGPERVVRFKMVLADVCGVRLHTVDADCLRAQRMVKP